MELPLLNRPSWDEYLMTMALLTASRSIDPSTKHGCVIVDDERTILSMGYNSPPRGCIDSMIPTSRPDKYAFFVHSEEAAIANAARTGTPLRGATAYVTGTPCSACLRMLINAGIKALVLGPIGSHCVDKATEEAMEVMLFGRTDFTVRYYQPATNLPIFSDVRNYYTSKVMA
jgi:dCMP deaminase